MGWPDFLASVKEVCPLLGPPVLPPTLCRDNVISRDEIQQLVEKLLRQPSASLRGARSLAYLFDRSRSLHASQLAASRRFSTSWWRLLPQILINLSAV
jgi:hypothetical protein